MSITRRWFLAAAASSSLAPVLPGKAFAIDPITALQAGAAVVGIIAGIAGMLSDAEFKRQMAEINAKLDQIIRMQVTILQELQALRLFITEALVRDRRDATATALNAQKDRFDILTATPLSRETRPLYDLLVSNVEQSAFEISRYDFSAYIPFSTGVAVDLVIYRILQVDSARLQALKKKAHDVYANWLNPNSAQSVTSLITRTEIELKAARDQLDAKARTTTLRFYTKRDGPHSFCSWTSILTVNGDFNTGFSGQVAEVRGECESLDDDICSPRRPCFMGSDFDRPNNSISASIPSPIPETNEFALVNEFNRDRNQIIYQMQRLANLYEVKGQLEALEKSFA